MKRKYLPEGKLKDAQENRELLSSEAGLIYAERNGIILESHAKMCDRDMTLFTELGQITGIMPKCEALYSPGEDIKDIAVITRVGKPVSFKIRSFFEKEGKKYALISRKDAQKECMDNYVDKLLLGDIINAKVTHTDRFGAFVDIGCGISALLPIDCMSTSRIRHSSERVSEGDEIRCAVKEIRKDPTRIFVTLKELLGTWEENAALFECGQTVEGIVRGVESYGVFVELTPNLAGLSEYKDGIMPGDRVSVYIKSLDKRKMKVKLVIVGFGTSDDAPTLKYFTDESTERIKYWRYSPEGSEREISTYFE